MTGNKLWLIMLGNGENECEAASRQTPVYFENSIIYIMANLIGVGYLVDSEREACVAHSPLGRVVRKTSPLLLST